MRERRRLETWRIREGGEKAKEEKEDDSLLKQLSEKHRNMKMKAPECLLISVPALLI